MKKIVCLLAFIYSISLTLKSQSTNSFIIVRVKGNCFYNRDKFKIPLKIGTCLSITDEIFVEKKSSVSFVCNSNNFFTTIENQKPFKIVLTKYSDSCKVKNKNVSANFLKYVVKNIKHSHEVTIDDTHTANLKEMGAVVRGRSEKVFSSIRDSICLYKKELIIKYNVDKSDDLLEFALYDDAESVTPILKKTISGNAIKIDTQIIKLMDTNQHYYWTVLKNGMSVCEKKVMYKYGDSDFDNLMTKTKNTDFQELSKEDRVNAVFYMLLNSNLISEAYETISKSKNTLITYLKKDLESEFIFH